MKAKKTLGAMVTSVGFVVGFAALSSAAPGSSIGTTGPDSDNEIKNTSSQYLKVKNDNVLNVENENHQDAYSGEAEVWHNTEGGDATSGDAMNENSFSGSATIDNSSATADLADVVGAGGSGHFDASIDKTGPHSDNKIENKVTSEVEISNDNYINVENTNHQTATSGDATVHGNTEGGSATTGDATNSNSTSLTFRVSN